MKVSSLTIQDLRDYLKIDNNIELDMLENILAASKSYVKSYTGLNDDQIDTKEDITIAVLVIANEMYSNREMTVDKDSLNPIVKSILDMHSINLL